MGKGGGSGKILKNNEASYTTQLGRSKVKDYLIKGNATS